MTPHQTRQQLRPVWSSVATTHHRCVTTDQWATAVFTSSLVNLAIWPLTSCVRTTAQPADVLAGCSFFFFVGPFSVQKRDACASVKIPEAQYCVRHSGQPVRRRQPRHVQSHLNLPFFPHSEARFEPRWVVFSGSTRLNALRHSAAAVRLANWIAGLACGWTGAKRTKSHQSESDSLMQVKVAAQAIWIVGRLSGARVRKSKMEDAKRPPKFSFHLGQKSRDRNG